MSITAMRLPEMIGFTILHSLWQITLLWIVLVSVLKLWPRASSALRYAFALTTLLLSILATAGTAVYEWQSYTPAGETPPASEQVTAPMMGIDYTSVNGTIVSDMVDGLNTAVPILAWLWFAGLAVMSARFGGSFLYLETLRAPNNTRAIPSMWGQALERLSITLGLGVKVAIATSDRIPSPLTLGSISPIILVPAGLLSGLSAAQVEAILVHELYHIKRRDYMINIGQALAETLLFYHPAIWHINYIIREERENCCDDKTVAFCGDAIAYARALTRIQEINTLTKPTLAMSATGPNAGRFTARIKRLFNIHTSPAQARPKGMFAIAALIVYLCIVVTSSNVSTAQPAGPEDLRTTDFTRSKISGYNPVDTDTIEAQSNAADGKESARLRKYPLAAKVDLQPADTTRKEQSLAACLRKVDLLLTMASLYTRPGDSLRFARFSPWDSLKLVRSADYLAKTDLTFQQNRFTQTVSRLKLIKSDLVDTGYAIDGWQPTPQLQPATALYIIDGVKIDRTQNHIALEGIPGGSIKSITVYKAQHAIDLYGDEGKYGVVVIELRPAVSFEESPTVDAVEVFPNSTNGLLNISFTPARPGSRVTMVLVDPDGRVVKEITDSTYDDILTELRVDLSSYKKGIYILQINLDGVRSQQRVVVE